MPSRLGAPLVAGAAVIAAAATLAACGSSSSSSGSSSKATKLSLTISDTGKTAKYSGVPASLKGGLVEVQLKNAGKKPHAAQLVLIRGNHTAQEALKVIASNSNKTPAWIRGQGGVGEVNPGQTQTATIDLAPGKYFVADVGGPSSGPPAYSQLTVGSGKPGTLPSTATTVTAATNGKDKYKWDVAGTLKPGANKIKFQSKGKDALHLIGAFKVTGNPSQSQLIKALKSNGKPPRSSTPRPSRRRRSSTEGCRRSARSSSPSPGSGFCSARSPIATAASPTSRRACSRP